MIHCRPETPDPKWSWMLGKATLTTVLSSMAMKRAKHIAPRVRILVRRSTANIRFLLQLRPQRRARRSRGFSPVGWFPAMHGC